MALEEISGGYYIASASVSDCYDEGVVTEYSIYLLRILGNNIYTAKIKSSFKDWVHKQSSIKKWWLNIDSEIQNKTLDNTGKSKKTLNVTVTGTDAYKAFFKENISSLKVSETPMLSGIPPTQIQKNAYALQKGIPEKAEQIKKQKEIIAKAYKLQHEREVARKKEAERQRLIAAKKKEATMKNQKNNENMSTGYAVGKFLRFLYDVNQANNKQQVERQSSDPEYIECYNEVSNRIASCWVTLDGCDMIGSCNYEKHCDKNTGLFNGDCNSGFMPYEEDYYCDPRTRNHSTDKEYLINKICSD